MTTTIRTYRHTPTVASDPNGTLVDTETDHDDGAFSVTVDTTGWATGSVQITCTAQLAGEAESAKSAPLNLTVQSAAPQTFGKTSVGATDVSFPASADAASVCKFTLLDNNAQVSKLSVYFAGALAGRHIKGVIYAADGTGAIPGTLKGATNELVGIAAGWNDLTFASPVTLQAGDYYLGVHALEACQGARGDTAGTNYFHGDTYSDGAVNPWGAAGSSSGIQKSIYATYTL